MSVPAEITLRSVFLEAETTAAAGAKSIQCL